MINNIILKNVATYEKDTETIIKPSKINFIYENNGTGKTTITRVIENPDKYEDSKLLWDKNIECSRLVYNQDFVKSNFNPETKLRGIYTLGEESEEIYKNIEKLTIEKKEILANKETKNEQLIQKEESIKVYKQSIEELFWNNYKKNYCDKVIDVYRGSINKKENFLEKCLSIEELDNNISFEDILEEYKTLYENELKEQKLIEKIDTNKFKQIISSDILTTKIIENKDITLSQLIEDLENSKWVEEGIKYLEKSENRCPFCQKDLQKEFIQNINLLYDEKYKKQKNDLNTTKSDFDNICNDINTLLKENTSIFNDSQLVIDVNEYIDSIRKEIAEKIDDPKYICKIDKDKTVLDNINKVIESTNKKIQSNNLKIKNIEESKNELKRKAWIFIRTISDNDIQKYNIEIKERTIEIQKIKLDFEKLNTELSNKEKEIENLENSITGITKTINQINDLLKKFNFNNFSLKENDDNLTYSIIRPNGEDATQTLSEGEFSFISFLYFYNLVFGSRNRKGLQEEHILIIDDPVTSMDSNVLFIISTLIRNLIELCIDEKRNINQIFILSHNVYFFKEVSFLYGKEGKAKTKEKFKFLTVQKINGISKIEDHQYNNPIKNSYELLWDSLRKKDYNDDSNLNNMRRILEQYFHTIGNGNPNNRNKELINKFDEKDRLIVKSLLSFINDGSHSIMDGLYMAPDINLNQTAFRLFREIFKELGHINHYNMMMQEETEDE